jgi:acyl-CoA reductase-like NAD-dependent aldehyde dehydrogenase
MLVLDRPPAPPPAFAGAVIATHAYAGALAEELAAVARRLRLGDPLDPATEAGPVARPEDVEAAVAAAEAEGAERLCGGPVEVPGLSGPFYAPAVLRGVRADSALVRDPAPGPVIAVVEAADEPEAIAVAARAHAVSVWTRDRARGERVARRLQAERTWVNEHGDPAVAPAVRLAAHQRMRSVGSRPVGALTLPAGPELADARLALARLAHGRESERWDALRAGAAPLARTALRLARSLSPR